MSNEEKLTRKEILKIILKWLPPSFFTIIAGIFIFVNFIFYEKTNKKLNNDKIKIENELRLLEFENNLRLTLYKEVKEAIVQKDTIMQKATLLVVNEMLDDDYIFRDKLINVLLQSTNSQKLIKTQQRIDTFQEEQMSIESDKFTIDIFYLEDILDEAKPLAEKVYYLLCTKYPQYSIRKRLLPSSINSKIGYQIDFNQIRYDINTYEKLVAEDILFEIQKNNIFKKEQPTLQGINNDTKNYLSIFIRNI
ncbi:MAG: hypothetical protein ACOXZ9_10040 [Bacteroidales bacterium]|jgi:hypothetical protein